MISVKGICPTCGKPYALKANGAIRRHNSAFPRCFTEDQLPKELIRSVRVITERGDKSEDKPLTENDENPDPDISSFA